MILYATNKNCDEGAERNFVEMTIKCDEGAERSEQTNLLVCNLLVCNLLVCNLLVCL